MSTKDQAERFKKLTCLAHYLLESCGRVFENYRTIPHEAVVDTILQLRDVLLIYFARDNECRPLLHALAQVGPKTLECGCVFGTSAHELAIKLANQVVEDFFAYAALEAFPEISDSAKERNALLANLPIVLPPELPTGREVMRLATKVDWEAAKVSRDERPNGEEHNELRDGTEEGNDEPNDRQWLILETMLHHGINSRRRRRTQSRVVQLMKPNRKPETYKRDFAKLTKLGYIHSQSSTGGGIWLTANGVTETKLHITPR
jgi:hypothetical protein